MCGGGGGQGETRTETIVQQTDLDPALRRMLYGGTIANPRGGFGGGSGGSAGGGSSARQVYHNDPMFGAGVGGDGGGHAGFNNVNDAMWSDGMSASQIDAARSYGTRSGAGLPSGGFPGGTGDHMAAGGMYAMGGMVQPQQGLASLNQGQMPMMNGGLPNLSDPMTAATLAMAMRGPQMQYGDIMAPQMPQQRFQDGGEVSPMLRRMLAEADRVEIGGAEVSPMLQRMLAEADRVEFGGPSAPYAGTTDRVYEAGPPVFDEPNDDGDASAQLEQILEELPPQERQSFFDEALEKNMVTPIRMLALALSRRDERRRQRGDDQSFFDEGLEKGMLTPMGMLALAYDRRQRRRQGFAMGGMIEGPGTGTSDSIDAVIMQNGQPVQQALLSDGEFVMTERAVRGAGNGDRDQGAARMYEMMRQFERGGRV